jgi:hypothetical protein
MTESELDALLAKPLASIADDGFSRGLVAKMTAEERTVLWFEWGAAAAVLLLVVLFAPVERLVAPFQNIAFDLGLSVPFAIACAALALSHAGLRLFAE